MKEQKPVHELLFECDKITEKEMRSDILNFTEMELYFFIDECGGFIWRMNHDMADGRIPHDDHAGIDKDIARIHKHQLFALKQLVRFGVDIDLADPKPTENYKAWYGGWNAWKRNMGNEEWEQIDTLMGQQAKIRAELNKVHIETLKEQLKKKKEE